MRRGVKFTGKSSPAGHPFGVEPVSRAARVAPNYLGLSRHTHRARAVLGRALGARLSGGAALRRRSRIEAASMSDRLAACMRLVSWLTERGALNVHPRLLTLASCKRCRHAECSTRTLLYNPNYLSSSCVGFLWPDHVAFLSSSSLGVVGRESIGPPAPSGSMWRRRRGAGQSAPSVKQLPPRDSPKGIASRWHLSETVQPRLKVARPSEPWKGILLACSGWSEAGQLSHQSHVWKGEGGQVPG